MVDDACGLRDVQARTLPQLSLRIDVVFALVADLKNIPDRKRSSLHSCVCLVVYAVGGTVCREDKDADAKQNNGQ